MESWHVYPERAKYLASRLYAKIEGEEDIWMMTIQMLVRIAGDAMVVLDRTGKE